MPYKDPEKRKQASRDSMDKKRKGLTSGVNKEGVNMVPASYVMGLNGKMYEALPERERYLELSDGQVFDRLNQPEGKALGFIEMMRCNEASYNYVPNKARKR